MTTLIHGGYVLGFDTERSEHILYRNGQVAFKDDRIAYVGCDYSGPADQTVDATGCLVSPGLINMHGIIGVGMHQVWLDSPREPGMVRPGTWVADPNQTHVFIQKELRDAARFSYLSMLRSGVTTFCGITTMIFKRWDDAEWEPAIYAELAGELGIRAYLSHQYRDGAPYVESDGSIGWLWNKKQGRIGLERALAFCEKWEGAFNDRVRTMLFPYTCDQTSTEILQATREAADSSGLRIRMHASQSPQEVKAILERTDGQTPIEYLDDIGFLGPDVLLTHCLHGRGFNGGPGLADSEIELLVSNRVTVGHCPWIYAMDPIRGAYLVSWQRYRSAGVNLVLGTDTQPSDLIREMRFAAIMGKVASETQLGATAREVFDAVTINAATFLGREDLGRLTPGAKADVIIIDLQNVAVGPHFDPIRSLVYYASMANVRDVWIDGKAVVRNHMYLTANEKEVVGNAQPTLSKAISTLVSWDRLGRNQNILYPHSYEIR